MKKYNLKSIALTLFLVLILILVFYIIIGINISGPYHKYEESADQVIEAIQTKHKNAVDVTRDTFKFVTFTCETKNKYIIYDENGKKLLERDKRELKIDEVNTIINNKYPDLAQAEVTVSYAYKNAAYRIEDNNNTLLLLDFDTLKKVFYMKEGA